QGFLVFTGFIDTGKKLDPSKNIRAVVLHLDPSERSERFGNERIRIYSVRRVSGFTDITKGKLGISMQGIPLTTFIFETDIRKIAGRLAEFRNARADQMKGRWAALKSFVIFDDPDVRDIVLETFKDVSDSDLGRTLTNQILLHEFIHNFLDSITGTETER